jgi:hypothetical protein
MRPSASAAKDPPSKISSSLPPTWFTKTIGSPCRAASSAIMRRRSSALPTCQGEHEGLSSTDTPALANSATGSIR